MNVAKLRIHAILMRALELSQEKTNSKRILTVGGGLMQSKEPAYEKLIKNIIDDSHKRDFQTVFTDNFADGKSNRNIGRENKRKKETIKQKFKGHKNIFKK